MKKENLGLDTTAETRDVLEVGGALPLDFTWEVRNYEGEVIVKENRWSPEEIKTNKDFHTLVFRHTRTPNSYMTIDKNFNFFLGEQHHATYHIEELLEITDVRKLFQYKQASSICPLGELASGTVSTADVVIEAYVIGFIVDIRTLAGKFVACLKLTIDARTLEVSVEGSVLNESEPKFLNAYFDQEEIEFKQRLKLGERQKITSKVIFLPNLPSVRSLS